MLYFIQKHNFVKQACHSSETYIKNARIYANVFLPKKEEEKLKRKTVSWTFYCGRQSGDLPIGEDHFIK
jgi:hypothetical protein